MLALDEYPLILGSGDQIYPAIGSRTALFRYRVADAVEPLSHELFKFVPPKVADARQICLRIYELLTPKLPHHCDESRD
jgi:hypothetical protein